MNEKGLSTAENEVRVRVRVVDREVVTSATASIGDGPPALTARAEPRAHPAAEMHRVKEEFAVGRALAKLGQKLQSQPTSTRPRQARRATTGP